MRIGVSLAAGMLFLSGCGPLSVVQQQSASNQTPSSPELTKDPGSASSNAPESNPSASEQPSDVQTATPPPTASPEPSESGTEAETAPGPCDATSREASIATIKAQQEAFARDDFPAARELASDSFRSIVTNRDFQQIIEGTYGFLLNDPSIEFRECRQMNDTIVLQVEIPGSPIIVMSYRLVAENGSWFIDGASLDGSRENIAA